MSRCSQTALHVEAENNLPADVAAQLSPWDPKILVSWVIFLGYAIGLVGNRWFGWRGKRMNVLAIVAFAVIIGALGVVQHFFPSFHKFYSSQAIVAMHSAGQVQ